MYPSRLGRCLAANGAVQLSEGGSGGGGGAKNSYNNNSNNQPVFTVITRIGLASKTIQLVFAGDAYFSFRLQTLLDWMLASAR